MLMLSLLIFYFDMCCNWPMNVDWKMSLALVVVDNVVLIMLLLLLWGDLIFMYSCCLVV